VQTHHKRSHSVLCFTVPPLGTLSATSFSCNSTLRTVIAHLQPSPKPSRHSSNSARSTWSPSIRSSTFSCTLLLHCACSGCRLRIDQCPRIKKINTHVNSLQIIPPSIKIVLLTLVSIQTHVYIYIETFQFFRESFHFLLNPKQFYVEDEGRFGRDSALGSRRKLICLEASFEQLALKWEGLVTFPRMHEMYLVLLQGT